MRKRLLFIVSLVSCILSAQVSVEEAFLTIPDTLCPFLNPQQSNYLLQIARLGETDSVANRFDGKSTLTQQDSNTLTLHVTEGVDYTLHTEGDTITLIQTVCAPICSSIVKTYTADWQYIRTIEPPVQGIFMEAKWAGDSIVYTDNTPAEIEQ